MATFLKPDFTHEEKIIAHTTVDLYLKHSNLDMKLQGSINGVKNLAHPDRGGPHKVRFHFVLFPKKKRKFKTGFQEPLELGIHLPFILNLVDKKDLSNGVLRLRMYGKREKFGLQVSREYCLGEAFIPLFQLDSDEKELNLVQAILPIGERFTSMLRDTPISTPKVRRKHYKSNLGSDSGSGESVNGDTSNRQSLAFSEYSGYSDSAPE